MTTELQQASKEQQQLLTQKGELYAQFIAEKDKSSGLQQENARLESIVKIDEREKERLTQECSRLKDSEQELRDEVIRMKVTLENTNTNQN